LVTPIATPLGLGQGVEMMNSSDSKRSQFQAQLAFWKSMADDNKSSRLPPVKRQKKRRRSEQFNQTMNFWSTLESPPKMALEEEKEPNPKINVLETKFDSTLNLFEKSKTASEIDKRKARKINRERERRKQIGVCFRELASELRLNRSSKLDKTLILSESRYTIQKLRQRNNELLKEREEMRKRIEKLTSCLQAMCSKPASPQPQQQNAKHTTHQLHTNPAATNRGENQGFFPPASPLSVPNNHSPPIDQDDNRRQDLPPSKIHSNSSFPLKFNASVFPGDAKSDTSDSISTRFGGLGEDSSPSILLSNNDEPSRPQCEFNFSVPELDDMEESDIFFGL